MSWFDDAACKGMDQSVFYLEVGASATPARKVCAGCPVSEECAAFAEENREKFGIWAGRTPRERGIHGMRVHPPAKVCPHGHEYTPENTYFSDLGRRRCRACNNAASRTYRTKKAS